MLVSRVKPFEGVDSQLRHLISAMLEVPVSKEGLVMMRNLLSRRDALLEQRLRIEHTA